TAVRTDKARQKDARDKRLAEARLVTLRESSVTPRDGGDTQRDEIVTRTEAAQQPVTLCSSDPSASDPSWDHPVLPPGDAPPAAAPPTKQPRSKRPKRWKRVPQDWQGPNESHRSKTLHWPPGKLAHEERRYRNWNF